METTAKHGARAARSHPFLEVQPSDFLVLCNPLKPHGPLLAPHWSELAEHE